VSALLSRLSRNLVPREWPDWLPGSIALVVLGMLLLMLVQREATRGLMSAERELRARATVVVVVPLVLCATLTLGTRFLQMVT
jgi:hypothetical protein